MLGASTKDMATPPPCIELQPIRSGGVALALCAIISLQLTYSVVQKVSYTLARSRAATGVSCNKICMNFSVVARGHIFCK